MHTDVHEIAQVLDACCEVDVLRQSPDDVAPLLVQEARMTHSENNYKNNAVTVVAESSAITLVMSAPCFDTVKRSRFTVRGFQQELSGEDHYSPTPMSLSVKLVLVWAASENWTAAERDCANAFLQSELDEVVFVAPPVQASFRSGYIW